MLGRLKLVIKDLNPVKSIHIFVFIINLVHVADRLLAGVHVRLRNNSWMLTNFVSGLICLILILKTVVLHSWTNLHLTGHVVIHIMIPFFLKLLRK